MKLQELFEKYADEYLEFEKVQNKLSRRHDLHAYMLLDKLFPDGHSILGHAGHDEVWLNIDWEEFEKIATEELVLELVRSGVRFDDGEGFQMFV